MPETFAELDVAQIFRVGDDRLHRSVFFNEALSRFRSDARHAGNIVGGVSHQPQDFHHPIRPHAELFLHGRRVVSLVLHRIDHRDGIADELHQVLVAGDDNRPPSLFCGADRQRANQIVRLDPLFFQDATEKARITSLIRGTWGIRSSGMGLRVAL